MVAKTLPALGVSAKLDKKSVAFHTKILSKQPVYDEREISKTPNNNMPDLARMVPKNILFFMNGMDLYAKYLHTKKFLSNFHPAKDQSLYLPR